MVQLSASLYLASKVNEYELVKIRDIINVVQYTLTRKKRAETEVADEDLGRDVEMIDDDEKQKKMLV